MILVSCTETAQIKDADNSRIIKEVAIRTTRIELEENHTTSPPNARIVYPKDSQLIKNSTVNVLVDADNFRIVPIGSAIIDGEGHFHVWLDGEMKVGAFRNFAFENVSSGEHSLSVELVKSDHSSLSPPVKKTIRITVDSDTEPKPLVSQSGAEEFIVEADDYGFYPENLSVRANDKIRISFKFKESRIYYGGLDIKGPFETINFRHGDKQPVLAEFTAIEDLKITSYWPSSNIKKADLTVSIE